MKLINYIAIALLIYVFASCKKDFNPVSVQKDMAGKINYYSTSVVLPQYSKSLFGTSIFINEAPLDILTPLLKQEYPFLIGQKTPVYASYEKGKLLSVFRLMKDIGAETAIKQPDIEYCRAYVDLSYDNKTLVYFLDGPVQELGKPAFNIVNMQQPEIPNIEAGKISLRILNASPDVGDLSVALIKPDGTEDPTNFPKALPYGQFTNDIALSTADVQNNNLIKLKITDKTGELLFYTGFSGEENRGYTLIINGFRQAHTITIPQGISSDANKTVIYAPVEFPVSLSASIRQIF